MMSGRLLILGLIVLLIASTASATTSKMGTAGATELRIPIGTRSTGMAGAVAADVSGTEALFWNPAGAVAIEGTEAYISYRSYIADMYVTYVGVASRFSYGAIGVNAKVLSLGDLYVTTENAWDGTGEVYAISIPVLGLTYAIDLTERVYFGMTAMYFSEEIMDTRARGLAFDLGFQYITGWDTFKIGLVMKNYGARAQYSGPGLEYSVHVPGDDPEAAPRIMSLGSAPFELPSYFQLGLSYEWEFENNRSFTLNGDFQSNNFSNDEWRLGGEYVYEDLFYLRGGYVYCSQDEYLYGPALGLGVRFKMGNTVTCVDYSHTFVNSYFDDVPEISIRFEIH
jgi:hypothetical protein